MCFFRLWVRRETIFRVCQRLDADKPGANTFEDIDLPQMLTTPEESVGEWLI